MLETETWGIGRERVKHSDKQISESDKISDECITCGKTEESL